MNTLIIYGYEEQSLTILLNEDGEIIRTDYANGTMWTIENSLIEFFGKELGEQLYDKLISKSVNLKDFNLCEYFEYCIQEEFTFNLLLKLLNNKGVKK